ncbi:sigma-70 family RNA polymerase sigma factor [Oryzomonas japonica]|uniref:Sigma-70 family RNA polymerase sigma factor n=1 Tax=Oryzomonas japonica TaxID=2603858 RepID=A0A7J4ZWA7_9BACT|nr:sigma-70 family RNA polymerase sigma factor [Oryzomonas japonica]KAB0667703.1 sigma-70 family RNA polymerase sigma factor [Oryzomonas japonica]
MLIWRVKPISADPEVTLTDWTIFEVSSALWPQKTRHFVGYNVYGREGRVSSAIMEFDAEKMIGVTRSGRVYRLDGCQGDGSPDGLHTWYYWCLRNKITNSHVVDPDQLSNQATESLEDVADDPDAQEITKEEKERLQRAMDALSQWFL